MSAALDSDRTRKNTPARSRELQAYEASLQEVERGLRSGPEKTTAPPHLHRAIMDQIWAKSCAGEHTPRIHHPLLRWAIPSATAVLALAGISLLLFMARPTDSQTDSEMAQILKNYITTDLSNAVPSAATAAVLEPIQQEMENVKTDVMKATKLVLTSLP